MKTTATILTAIVFTFLSIFSFGQEKYKVSVKVKGTGENFIAFLIDNDENFPGVTPTSRQLTQNSDGTFAIFEFDKVLMGTYAVMVFHDKNGNGQLDMNGQMPAEPFGYSNYVAMGPPEWSACSFSVEEDVQVTVNLVSF
jgi:uncharacterized protein (DUF2141 family)